MRTLILTVVIALTVLVSTGAGALAFGGSGKGTPSATVTEMGSAMETGCPSRDDHETAGAHADHALCKQCATCCVLAAALPEVGTFARQSRPDFAIQRATARPAGRDAAGDPPIPRT